MTNTVKLYFSVLVYCQRELAEDLREDLATFLMESWFNGDDVLEVEYLDHEVKF